MSEVVEEICGSCALGANVVLPSSARRQPLAFCRYSIRYLLQLDSIVRRVRRGQREVIRLARRAHVLAADVERRAIFRDGDGGGSGRVRVAEREATGSERELDVIGITRSESSAE